MNQETIMEDNINRNPTPEQIMEALKQHSSRYLYVFGGGCLGSRKREEYGKKFKFYDLRQN